MTKTIHIRLFGRFELTIDGCVLSSQEWQSQQTQTIGKILIANKEKVITSEQLIENLWPDDPFEMARRRLHVRVSQLRSILQGKKSLLQTVNGGYMFQPDETCWVDLDQFQSYLEKGNAYIEEGQQIEAINVFEKARELYRGDFLAEDLYAEWTFHQRESLRETFINLLIELSESYAQQGRYRLAITRTRQALAKDPLRETIYVRLMLYHYYAGERNQSLRIYEQCKEMLQTELGVRPLESTHDLFTKIKEGNLWKDDEGLRYPPPIYEGRLFEVPYALTEIPLVGRELEYAWLISQWQQPEKRIITIEGEAGIGKSRLLNRFTDYVHKQSIRLLKVQLLPSAHQPTTAIFSALQELITDSVIRRLNPETLAVLAVLIPEIHDRVDSIPELTPLLPNGEQQRLNQAITDLAAVCSSVPTLIVVDDAQRLSSAAVDLLIRLSKTFRVLLSYRSEDTPADHPVRIVFGPVGLALKPLTLANIQSLLIQLSGSPNPVLAEQIHIRSDGVPLFVVALLQHMFEMGYLFVNSVGEWEITSTDTLALPMTLRATIEARLNHLNQTQRRIFDFAAVMNGKFNFDLLKFLLQQSEEDLLSIVDVFLDTGLLIEPRSMDQPDFKISHDYYTEIAYVTIPAARRRAMHNQVARVIENLYEDQVESYAATLADHYHRAEKVEETIHYAKLASQQALDRFASIEALHYIDIALPLIKSEEIEQIAQLLLRREGIFDLHGMRKEQNEDLQTLEALYPDLSAATQAEIRLRRAGYEWIIGNNDATYNNVEAAIEIARSAGARKIEAQALLLAGRACLDQTQSILYLERALQVIKDLNFFALEGDIIRCLGNATYWQNKYHQSAELFHKALNIHRKVGDLRGELSALNNLAKVTELIGDLSESVEYYTQAAEISQRIRDRLAEGVILTNLAQVTTSLGKFLEAETQLEKAIMIRKEIGNDEGVALALNNLGYLHRITGQYDRALSDYNLSYDINTRIDHPEQTFSSLVGLSTLYRDLGQYDQAENKLSKAAEILPKTDSFLYVDYLIHSSLLKTFTAELDTALDMGKEALECSKNLPWFHAPAAKNFGHAYLAQGQLENARQYFQQAINYYQTYHQSHLIPEPLAGLAKISLLNKMPEKAMGIIQEFTPEVNRSSLQGLDRLIWTYLIIYEVLTANNDPQSAEIIETAYQTLVQRDDTIADEKFRQTYLTGISDHREVIQIWQSLSNGH